MSMSLIYLLYNKGLMVAWDNILCSSLPMNKLAWAKASLVPMGVPWICL